MIEEGTDHTRGHSNAARLPRTQSQSITEPQTVAVSPTSQLITVAAKHVLTMSAHHPSASNLLDLDANLWQQLEHVTILTFSGNKWAYGTWKSAFTACIDRAPATTEYKLLQLCQCLHGETLKAVDGLGHSVAAYDTAKARLEKKYGRERRQVTTYLEEILQFAPVCLGKAEDLDHFVDLINMIVINLKDTTG